MSARKKGFIGGSGIVT